MVEGRRLALLYDAREVPPGTVVEREVCVIGAGAAGITLALELGGAPFRVALLESGGFEPEPATQDLYRGVVYGRAYHPLHEARTRRFGGSTNCWMGMCRPLEPIDLEPREWVPHSGWPFGFATLRPFYDRAQRVLGLEGYVYDGSTWATPERPVLPLERGVFETRNFQIVPSRFGQVHRRTVASAANLDTFLHANAVELRPSETGARIESVRVAALEGSRFDVRARVVVVATGGIENARLLLASNQVQPGGIGNAHDLVGRFFMDHPHVTAAAFLPARADLPLDLYHPHRHGRVLNAAVLMPTAEVQRRDRVLDFWAVLTSEGALPGFERSLARVVHGLDGAPGEPASRAVFLLAAGEQAPNPQSRVRLADERDALGMPRVRLEWRLSAIDKRSMLRGHRLLARELARAGLGRLQILLGDDEASWPDDLSGGRHHIGTTRMHDDPRQGVVDANGRVHGLGNLYVAGSSVFPTSGAANPTLTIVALAVRLADHLKEVLA
jgi:choline dehydrogenase-like flavoprotein